MKNHIEFLDGIRGIAILAVFLFHCLGCSFGFYELPWGRWLCDFSTAKSILPLIPFTFGWAGVAMFFVVSGFCIHLSFLNGPANDWHGFFARRFFRIYPPYFVAMIFFALIFPFTQLSPRYPSSYAQFGSHLLLFHNLDFRSFYGINPSFWSIAVEVQLYLIYPALLVLVKKFGWRGALTLLCLLEVAMRGFAGVYDTATGHPAPRWFSGLPFSYWFSWAVGAALADALAQKRPLPFRSQSVWLLGGAAVVAGLVRPLFPLSFLFFALLTVSVMAKLLDGRNFAPLPRWTAAHLSRLGICSYSFYLLHQPLVMAFSELMKKLQFLPQHPVVLFAVCVATYPCVFSLAWLYYRYCESLSISLGKQYLRKLTPQTT
jgi:peptidoglycan/LPS O-acetylase OafA/YrhL